MRTFLRVFALTAAAVAPVAAQQTGARQQAAPAPAASNAPMVGAMAPDFTAQIAGHDGIVADPVTLSKLKGKVVVLAFYPGDRTPGCTIELTKFTTDYAKLFPKDVVVLPISKDPLASHESWAKAVGMPFNMISDTAGTVATLYGSQAKAGARFTRNLFIIGKDGKIAFSIMSLNVNSEDAYTQMAAAIVAADK
jgi:peroxiredoxin Q/BCP